MNSLKSLKTVVLVVLSIIVDKFLNTAEEDKKYQSSLVSHVTSILYCILLCLLNSFVNSIDAASNCKEKANKQHLVADKEEETLFVDFL